MDIKRETKLNDDFFKLYEKVDLKLIKKSGRLYVIKIYKKTNNKNDEPILMFEEKYQNTNYDNNNKTIDEIFGKAYKNSKKGQFIAKLLDKVNNFSEYKKEQKKDYLSNRLMCLKQNLKVAEQHVYDIIENIEEVNYQLSLIEK